MGGLFLKRYRGDEGFARPVSQKGEYKKVEKAFKPYSNSDTSDFSFANVRIRNQS
jgi:hypothetical protein